MAGLDVVLGALLAFLISLLLVLWRLPHMRRATLQEFREQLEREAEVVAKERLYRERDSFENALESTRHELKEIEDRCRIREDALDRRLERLEERERALAAREAALKGKAADLEAQEAELERTRERRLRELEKIAGMRREEAEHLLLEEVERGCAAEAEDVRSRAEEALQDDLTRRAREALLTAMQRLVPREARASLVTPVTLGDDELKGALIGREGRNARAFEAATGVDLLIDDTPGLVVLSAFDPVRRELARRALERLLDEGGIDPERIATVVAQVRSELEAATDELGAAAAAAAHVDDLHPRLTTLLGRLEFRASDGRNLREHAVETALFASALAGELGLDPTLARRAGLLHGVGRAVVVQPGDAAGDEVGKPGALAGHAAAGAEFARRCGESPAVVEAIAAQEGRGAALGPYAALTRVAAEVCARRPGATAERVDQAIRRREELEAIAERHPGVRRAYAVQAGRGLRVIVDPTKVSEKLVPRLARELAKELEAADAPGEVEVIVLRETRHEETAP